MRQTKAKARASWILGFALASIALTFLTSWAFIIQVALLGVGLYQLTLKPTKKDRTLLLIACGAITISLVWIVVVTITVYSFSGDVEVTSVPLP